MAGKRLNAEERFIRKNHLEAEYAQAKVVEPDLWNILQGIKEHYCEYSKHYEAIVQQTVLDILGDKKAKGIHSIRYRIKKSDSLLAKVVKKKAFLSKEVQRDYDIEKYRDLNAENYFKIITDIGGIRILIRYREQWLQVHNWIWEKYFKGEEYYLRNYVEDYKSNAGKSFIVERPKVYYRNDKDRIFYEQIDKGENIFEFRRSDEGYNSLHYLINIDGKYIEIQMRTILDEAWSECTHDIVYKGTNKAQRAELEYLSQCLSQQTIAAEAITNLIYEKVNKKGTIYGKKQKPENDKKTKAAEIKGNISSYKVEERMRLLEQQDILQVFDGKLDSII